MPEFSGGNYVCVLFQCLRYPFPRKQSVGCNPSSYTVLLVFALISVFFVNVFIDFCR